MEASLPRASTSGALGNLQRALPSAMPRRIDLPLNVAISVDMAPMLHAIMLPLTIPTPPLQMKFLKLLGEIVEDAHHSAICVPEQRLQFKRALECARTAAANSMFQSKVQGRDDSQEPRSPLLPTKAQEAQQARAEPRPQQQERSPRAALATPLSGGCMHPIEERILVGVIRMQTNNCPIWLQTAGDDKALQIFTVCLDVARAWPVFSSVQIEESTYQLPLRFAKQCLRLISSTKKRFFERMLKRTTVRR
eukprot:s5660_g4.t1